MKSTRKTSWSSNNPDDQDPAAQCLARALRCLTVRDRTVAELRRHLADGGSDDGTVEETLARLAEMGYLDDRRVAQQWADASRRSGRWFGLRLRNELLRRGVPREIAEDVCREQSDGTEEAARILVLKRYPSYSPATATMADRQRIYRFLLRRGIPPAEAMSALNAAAAEDGT